MRRCIALAAIMLAAVALLAPAAAQAETFNILSMDMGYQIKLHVPVSTPQFRDQTRWLGTAEFETQIPGWSLTAGYCLDPYAYAYTGSTTMDMLLPGEANRFNSSVLTTDGALKAAYLVTSFSSLADGSSPYGDKVERTALQLAIWEVVSDELTSWPEYNNYGLNSGGLRFMDAKSGQYDNVLLRATTMLSTLYAAYTPGSGFDQATIDQLNDNARVFADGLGNYRQDIIAARAGGDPGSATPEPGSLLLMGSAAGVLGFYRRRRRA